MPASVVLTQQIFDECCRGKVFTSWEALAAAIPPEPSSDLLLAGLALALLILINVIVWIFVFWSVVAFSSAYSARAAGWLALGLLGLYGLVVNLLCYAFHSDSGPAAMVSRVFFGACPATTSLAAYLLGLLLVDSGSWSNSFDSTRFNTQPARIVGLLAVLPGLAHSVFLFGSRSTGFEAAGLPFDILGLCVFVDVARLVFHLAFLRVPPHQLSDKLGDVRRAAISVYLSLAVALCLGWLTYLARCVATGSVGSVGAAALLSAALSFARVRVLVSLASFTFLPCAWALAVFRSTQALRAGEIASAAADRAFLGVMGAATSALFVCSAYFDDAPEPAFLGCAALLVIAFWAATRLSASKVCWPAPVHMVVLLVLLGFALLTVGVMQLVARFAAPGRAMMRAAMASARVGSGVVLAAATVPLAPALVQHHRALVAKRAEEERKKREAAARAARPPAAGECAIA